MRVLLVAILATVTTAALGQSTGLPDPNACPSSGCNFTGPVQLSADPTTSLAPATKQYVDGHTGGSGAPIVSGTTGALPLITSTTGAGQLGNSHFTDSGTVAAVTEPFNLVGEFQQATGTANSSNNFVSNVTNWLISYWNGSAPVSAQWSVYAWVAQGASPPATVLTYQAPASLTTTAVLYAIDPGLVATSSANFSSPKFKTRGSCWNGTASVLDDWNWQGIPGAGANPVDTLTFTNVGCGGKAVVQMPGLTLQGAPFELTAAANNDLAGELTLSSATTATYTWAGNYATHPECTMELQFNSSVARWFTYTGTTSFTINFASAVSGTVSYLCVGRS